MNNSVNEHQVAEATQVVKQLSEQAEQLRDELKGVQQKLSAAQIEFDEQRSSQLVEANEQLALAAIHAQFAAETATSHLGELTEKSQCDALTNTPNRALMLDRLENAIAMAQRHGVRVAVLFIDLDQFKQINDTLGHLTGDKVLQLVARRMEAVVRDTDTVSRHGGDEFLILLTEVSQASDAALIAANILTAIKTPCTIDNQILHLSASIGIAIYPDDGVDALSIISQADAAMYRSKKLERGNFQFHVKRYSGSSEELTHEPEGGRPLMCYDFSTSVSGTRTQNLCEANEHLVLSALSAQDVRNRMDEASKLLIKFMAMVAHELQTPVASIRSAGKLLEQTYDNMPALRQIKGIIARQADNMARLVDDLLAESRLRTGKFQLKCEFLDIADILQAAVETYALQMNQRQQPLHLHLPPNLGKVYGDPLRLEQIFCNLLDNASKFTPKKGSISLQVEKRPQAIDIIVIDNGIGVRAEILPKIFDLFVRDSYSEEQIPQGLGIGLTLVRELVEAHGGSVHVSSGGWNMGSKFVVSLPIADEPD